MAKRHSGETILVQWTIGESLWRDFLREKEERYRERRHCLTFTPPDPFPVSGIEVVIRDDAIFVGGECVREYVYDGGYHGFSVNESILEMYLSSDTTTYVYLLPITRGALADAKRVVERLTAEDSEQARIRAAERARPTLRNRLLWWIEAHFVLAMFAFFFGLLPLFVLCLYLLLVAFGLE